MAELIESLEALLIREPYLNYTIYRSGIFTKVEIFQGFRKIKSAMANSIATVENLTAWVDSRNPRKL